MKRAASSKHRQAIKTIQCEKKYFKIHLILLKLGKCIDKKRNFNTPKKCLQQTKSFCLFVVAKRKRKSALTL